MGIKKHRSIIHLIAFCCIYSLLACTSTKTENISRKNCAENNLIIKPKPGQPVSPLSISGPCIVNEKNTPVELRGVSIADPEHLERRTASDSAKKTFNEAVAFGSSIIRIPVHKGDEEGWGISKGISDYLDSYVDPLVDQAIKSGVYVILDLHLVSDYLAEKELVQEFWSESSLRYGSISNVIFELYNEPIYPDSWSIWKQEIVDPVLAIIRRNAPNTLVIIGSPYWSGHVADALFNSVTDGPVAYTAHIYPQTPKKELEQNYYRLLGRLPLIVTEWGFNADSDSPLQGDRKTFGEPTIAWMKENGISWTAWIFDNRWGQSIFNEAWELRKGDDYMGDLVQEQLNER